MKTSDLYTELTIVATLDDALTLPEGVNVIVPVENRAPEEVTRLAGRDNIALRISLEGALDMVDLPALISRVPDSVAVIICADAMGDRGRVIPMLMSVANTAVYFRATDPRACVDAMITSSLGVDTGIIFAPEYVADDRQLEVIDRELYSRRGRAGHIEPWHSMARGRRNGFFLSPGITSLCDATIVDVCGNDVIDLDSVRDLSRQRRRRWQECMIAGHPCSFCGAMRLCDRFFTPGDACRELMTEALLATDFSLKNSSCQQ